MHVLDIGMLCMQEFFFFCLMGKLRWDSLCLMFSLLLKKEHDFQENENIALRFLDKKE